VQRQYDSKSGIQTFQVGWISKASAAQRAGRAGRTGPGHCYRLYSSAVFEHHFPAFAAPEITRVPIEGVVLQMKAMHLDAVVRFPFPTPPDPAALARAERALVRLGALAPPPGTHVTALGRAMALFPLAPRFAKMLANGRQRDCLPYVVAVVAALSVGDPFLREEALEGDEDEEQDVEGLEHITGEAARAKEMRRLRRRAFFESQHVRPRVVP
jgi:ATP-dependent RNA helicase DHX37/DHR1